MNDTWNSITSNGAVRIAVVGVLAILALFLLAETVTVAQGFGRFDTPATNTITVNGEGTASLAPDIAHITFTVMDTESTAAIAQSVTNKKAAAGIDVAKQQGIADADVTTLSYDISPQYSYPNCPPGVYCPNTNGKITGYQVSETVQLTVRDLDKISDVLAGLGGAGADQVSGPDFALDSPTAGQDAARTHAIQNAKDQAAELARELGVHLGQIVSFSDNNGGYPIYNKAMAPMAAGADSMGSAPSVPVGTNEYSSSVSITYEIR